MKRPHFLPFLIISASLLLAMTPVKATLLVYEGFDYTSASQRPGAADTDPSRNDVLLHGKNGGIGFSSAWADSTTVVNSSDLFISTGSLSFGDLPAYGNQTRSDTNQNNDTMSRSIAPSLATGNNELWFSFLANKLQNNFSAAEGGIAITNQVVGNSRIFENNGADGLQGFAIAPTTAGNNWTAYGWDGSSITPGGAAFTVPTNGTQTNFLLGRIQYDAGAGGADIFTIYRYDLTASGGAVVADPAFLDQITSLEVDVDQSLLNTLVLTRQVNTAYDEILVGTSLSAVILPEPSKSMLFAFGLLGFLLRRQRRV